MIWLLQFVMWLVLTAFGNFGVFGPPTYPTCGNQTCGTGANGQH